MTGPLALGQAAKVLNRCDAFDTGSLDLSLHRRPRIGYFLLQQKQVFGNGFNLLPVPWEMKPSKIKPEEVLRDWHVDFNPFVLYKYTYLFEVTAASGESSGVDERESRSSYKEHGYADYYHNRTAWRTPEEVRERGRRFPV